MDLGMSSSCQNVNNFLLFLGGFPLRSKLKSEVYSTRTKVNYLQTYWSQVNCYHQLDTRQTRM